MRPAMGFLLFDLQNLVLTKIQQRFDRDILLILLYFDFLHKQCVICGNMYTTVTDSTGRETLTLFNVPSISPNLIQSQRHDSRDQFQVSSQPITVR